MVEEKEIVVEVKDLVKKFDDRIILNGVNLKIPRGEIFVIMGGTIMVLGWVYAGCVIYAGRCLAKRKRYLYCLVMAGICCLFFPFGTALGVFAIIVLIRPSVKELFGSSSRIEPT